MGFNSATFWYINILGEVGRKNEARNLFGLMLKCLTPTGIISETIDLESNELWGNFPHNSALVGLISCAISLSKPWKDAL